MVGIVTSNFLGLTGSSKDVLGGKGEVGVAGLGQAGGQINVNAKTGNLILVQTDEILAGRGPDIGITRIYNSAGGFDYDNGDSWQLSLYRKLGNFSGSDYNTVGSSIKRYAADGAVLTYTYDAGLGKYVNKNGGGSYDTLAYNTATQTWTWTDGDSRATETFTATVVGSPLATAEWRVVSQADLSGNKLVFGYDAALGVITQITEYDAQGLLSGDSVQLVYDANKRLQSVQTTEAGVNHSRVGYTYDTSGRLKTVTTDLTPADDSIVDGKVYTTTYGYDVASNRVTSIVNSDGTQASFTYETSGAFRLKTIVDGAGKTTTFSYSGGGTSITNNSDGVDQNTDLSYDSNGNLTTVFGPVGSGQYDTYQYNANGDLISFKDKTLVALATYAYDGYGNRVREQDATGNVIERTYNSANQLVRLTTYNQADTDGISGANRAHDPQSTNYYYDANQRLRFVVSPEGRVTEYQYDNYGQATITRSFTNLYNPALPANWTSDFNANFSYVTAQVQRDAVNGTATFSSVGQTSGNNPAAQLVSRPLGNGVRWRFEFTTPASYAGGLFNIALLSGELSLWLNANGAISMAVVTGGTTSFPSSKYKTNTTYVTEITFDANGLVTISLAEKGAPASSADIIQSRITGTTTPKIVLQTQSNSNSTVVVGNLTNTPIVTTADLATWAGSQTQMERIDTDYDLRGLVKSVTRYAGNDGNGTASRTEYVYDAHGRLLQKIEPRGTATTGVTNDFLTAYAYDGLGRIISVTAYDEFGSDPTSLSGNSAKTETTYIDGSKQISVKFANGRIQLSIYDARGLLISQRDQGTDIETATTTYGYDALGRLTVTTDPNGIKTYTIYSPHGRVAGTIDGTGFLTEYSPDHHGNILYTYRYNGKSLDPNTGLPLDIPALFAPAADGTIPYVSIDTLRPPPAVIDQDRGRLDYRVYDDVGRLTRYVDPEGYITSYTYDGAGRLTDTVRYANPVSEYYLDDLRIYGIYPDSVELDTRPRATNATLDRRTRSFYNADGLLAGVLDSEGYLTRYFYNGAGERIQTLRYATQSPSANWVTGNLNSLIPTGSADDQISDYIYDGQGRVVAAIDAERYLTTTAYDVAGNVTQTRRYATRVSYTPGNALALPATNPEDQSTQFEYDARNRVIKQTTLPDGTVTTYAYDKVGNLIETKAAKDTSDERIQTVRYDQLGRVTAELGGVGSAELAALVSPTQAQVDGVWNRYGTRYVYDKGGRRVAMITPDGTGTTGNKSVYYYDAANRLVYGINALGEVTEYRYDVAITNSITTQVQHANRLDAALLAGLTGGSAAAIQAVAAGLTSADDRITRTTYDTNGAVVGLADAYEVPIVQVFRNAFGEAFLRYDALYMQMSAVHALATEYSYDRRGLSTRDQYVVPSTTLHVTAYDAFGRPTQTTDARGNVTRFSYDRLGRQLTVAMPSGTHSMSYDAFGRVLTQMDAYNNPTTFTYDSANRSFTVNTAEGVSTTTVKNRFGETISVTDGKGNVTTYQYDRDGRLKSTTQDQGGGQLNLTSRTTYDAAGHVYESIDANDTVTRYTYDAAGRVLTRAVDPTGLNLTTQYRYDAFGDAAWICDPNGTWTRTEYDKNGRVTAVTVDPLQIPNATGGLVANTGGLNLGTTYTYDVRGHVLRQTEAAGTTAARVTEYQYDDQGRRIREIVDPDYPGLNLITSYTYDANDNVISKIDPADGITRYIYDTSDRLVYEIDPIGAVRAHVYDAEGREVRTIAYANVIDLEGLDLKVTSTELEARLQPLAGADEVSRRAYDRDGRLVVSIDSLGYATAYAYDGANNVIRTTRYATAVQGTLANGAAPVFVATAPGGGAAYVILDAARDRVERTYYDGANRPCIMVDAAGYVTRLDYTPNGKVSRTLRYANPVVGAPSNSPPAFVSTPPGSGTYVLLDSAKDQAENRVYDSAGRLSFLIDAGGYATAYLYDADSRLTKTTRHANPVQRRTDLISGVQLVTAAPPTGTYVLVDAINDLVVSQSYDKAGRVKTGTDAMGVVTTHTYDAAGNQTESVVASNVAADAVKTRWIYDTGGRLIQEIRAADTGVATAVYYTRDTLGRVTDETLAGVTTHYVYDALGRVTSKATAYNLPEQAVIQTTYDAFGNAVSVTDPNGNVGYFWYDKQDRAVLHIDPEGYATATSYTAFGAVQKVTRYATRLTGPFNIATPPVPTQDAAHDQVTQLEYDALNRQIKLTDAESYYESTVFDAFGNKQSFTNKLGGTFSYEYDKRGNVLTETLPLTSANSSGTQVAVKNSYTYDARGNRLTRTEAVGLPEQRITTWTYDALNRVKIQAGEAMTIYNPVTDATSTVTPTETRTYDARGNLILSIDPTGAGTYTWYDALDRKIATVDALGYLSTWKYTPAGDVDKQFLYVDPLNLASLTAGGTPPAPASATARETRYAYDGNHRLLTTTTPDVLVGNGNPVDGYAATSVSVVTRQTYDNNGNVIVSEDGRGGKTFRYYDTLGHKVLEVDAERYFTAWEYDLNGNITRETRYATKLAGAVTVATTSSPAALKAGLSSVDDRISEFVYDRMNRVTMEKRLNVQSATVNSSNGVLTEDNTAAITAYVYDGLGNVKQKTNAVNAVDNWTFDKLGREVQHQGAAFADYTGATVRQTTDTEYNGLGSTRRTIERGTNPNPADESDDHVTKYAYGKNGYQLSQTDAMNVTTDYQTDAMGRITKKTLVRNTSVATVSVTDITTYSYDGRGQQVKQKVSSGVSLSELTELQTQETQYDAYGNITGKRTYVGAAPTDWQEKTEYDLSGHVVRTNSGNGITKIMVYDANGNATLTLDSPTLNLAAADLTNLQSLAGDSHVNKTYAAFDARNQLTDTWQPSMETVISNLVIRQNLTTSNDQGVSDVSLVTTPSATAGAAVTQPVSQGTFGLNASTYVRATSYRYLSSERGYVDITLRLDFSNPLGDGDYRVVFSSGSWPFQAKDGIYTTEFTFDGALTQFNSPLKRYKVLSNDFGYSSFTIYKPTSNGDVILMQGSIEIEQGGNENPRVDGPKNKGYTAQPLLQVSGQEPTADRVVLLYRTKGSDAGWSTVSVPKRLVGGAPVAGSFELNWVTAGISAGNYEVQYYTLDSSGSVLNYERGDMNLVGGSPGGASQTSPGIGGSGRAFFDTNRAINFTDQGATATKLTVKYRPYGGQSAWTTVILNPASIAGTVTNGWFKFNTSGIANGSYEYTIQAATDAGVTLTQASSTFTIGSSNWIVTDPSGTAPSATPATTVGVSTDRQVSMYADVGYYEDPWGTGYLNGTTDWGPFEGRVLTNRILNLTLPDTSAWGNEGLIVYYSIGAIYVSDSEGGRYIGYNGASGNFDVSNGAQTIHQSLGGDTGVIPSWMWPTDGGDFSYQVYKKLPGGGTKLLVSGGGGTSTGGSNTITFTPASSGASRMILQYRQGNGNWNVASYAKNANGAFAIDWTNATAWPRGDYEYRETIFASNGDILQTGSGNFTVPSGNTAFPTVTKTDQNSGGVGRAFLDTSNKLNITEQGTAAQSLLIRYRQLGTTEWGSTIISSPASVGGSAVPGWFVFDPAAQGLTGACEYYFEVRNAGGLVINSGEGGFVTGIANSVTIANYQPDVSIVRFGGQTANAATLRLSYRRSGSSDAWVEIVLPKINGVFEWDTGAIFNNPFGTADYEFFYEALDGAGNFLKQGTGVARLGASPMLIDVPAVKLTSSTGIGSTNAAVATAGNIAQTATVTATVSKAYSGQGTAGPTMVSPVYDSEGGLIGWNYTNWASFTVPDTSAWGNGPVVLVADVGNTVQYAPVPGQEYWGLVQMLPGGYFSQPINSGVSSYDFALDSGFVRYGYGDPQYEPHWGGITLKIYKTLSNGSLLEISSGSPGAMTGASNQINFSTTNANAARLLLQYRPKNSNAAWTVGSYTKTINTNTFAVDWTNWARDEYEYFETVLSGTGDVLQSGSGTFNLPTTTLPTITETDLTVGGVGRAFMGSGGKINILEQGPATTLAVRYRQKGSTEWSNAVPLSANTGTTGLGWFVFDPAAQGLTGPYEYYFEARNASGSVINRGEGSFTTGDTNSVTIAAYRPDVVKVRFNELPGTTAAVRLTYRLTGTNDPGTSVNLNRLGTGQFEWDASMIAPGLVTSTAYDFSYEAFDVGNALIKQGTGTVRLGANPALVGAEPVYMSSVSGIGSANAAQGGASNVAATTTLTVSAVPNKLMFTIGAPGATRVMLQYRPKIAGGDWTVKAASTASSTLFTLDCSNATTWPRVEYEYREIVLDSFGKVLQTGSGAFTLPTSGTPTISKTDQTIGGIGRAFMESGSRINIVEQGQAQSLTLRYRPAGSTIWSTTVLLQPSTQVGSPTPGWFVFDALAQGLNGSYEYYIEARDASNAVINRAEGKFTTGNPNSVTLGGYQPDVNVLHFGGQPASVTQFKLSYHAIGSSAGWTTNVVLPHPATGQFDWDVSMLLASVSNSMDYEFTYQALDASNNVVNAGHGIARVGARPELLSHVADQIGVFNFPIATTGAAKDAVKLELEYRAKNSTGPFLATTLTRTGNDPFTWDSKAASIALNTNEFEYRYVLKNAQNVVVSRPDGSDYRVEGVLAVGGTVVNETPVDFEWKLVGNPTNQNVAIHRSQKSNAFGEVAQETDGLNHLTEFRYNTLGKMVEKKDPQTLVTLENGYQKTMRPTTTYYYDLQGRLVGVRDPNGYLNTQVLFAPGEDAVAAEFHADTGIKQYRYDAFGDVRAVIDEMDRRTDYSYDANDRLVRIDRAKRPENTVRGYDAYEYDGAGQRIAHTTTPDGTAVYRDTTDYDALGRVTSTLSAEQASRAVADQKATFYTYTYIAGMAGLPGAVTGGWRKTVVDPNGRAMVDDTDMFNRQIRHTDLGGHVFDYTYNYAGWLTRQSSTNTGQDLQYDYYANGYLKRIDDNVAHARSEYAYDAEGNRTYEAYSQEVNGQRQYFENSTIYYDELNRVSRVLDSRAEIRYEYDAAGNRRHIWSYYHDGTGGNMQVQDYWYLYDKMNRFTVTMGTFTGDRATSESDTTVHITRGTTGDGVGLGYDKAGNRIQAIYAKDGHREDYVYSEDGFLKDAFINANASQQGILRARRINDLLGRVTSYQEYAANGSSSSSRTSIYNRDNKVTQDTSDGVTTTYSLLADGTLDWSRYSQNGTTITNYYAYEWWDSAKESTIKSQAVNQAAPGWQPGISHYTYDANGHLASAIDEAGGRRFNYASNAEGMILQRQEVTGAQVHRHDYYYVNGHRIGDLGNDGDPRMDYAQALSLSKQDRKEKYASWKPISSADFDQNFEPINSAYPGAAAGTYVVKKGDTLKSIASSVWGDSSLWYLLADTNGLIGGAALTEGQVLTVPNKVTNIHNNSSTYRVYNPGEAIGDLTPTIPDPPPPPQPSGKKGCGGIGAILVAVVAVVATVLTAGALAGATAPGLAGLWSAGVGALGAGVGVVGVGATSALGWGGFAIAGAVGSIASQVVGMATGIQNKFSWSGVAMAAIGSAAGGSLAGSGSVLAGKSTEMVIARAVAGNLITQGIGVATGLQPKFSWANVAASAAGAWAGQATQQHGAFLSDAASSLAGNLVRAAVSGKKPNWSSIAAEAIADGLTGWMKDIGTSAGAGNQVTDEIVERKGQDSGAFQGLTPSKTVAEDWAGRVNGMFSGAAEESYPTLAHLGSASFLEGIDYGPVSSSADNSGGQESTSQYVVRRGDSLSDIGHRLFNDARVGIVLASRQGIDPNAPLQPGQVIDLSDSGASRKELREAGQFLADYSARAAKAKALPIVSPTMSGVSGWGGAGTFSGYLPSLFANLSCYQPQVTGEIRAADGLGESLRGILSSDWSIGDKIKYSGQVLRGSQSFQGGVQMVGGAIEVWGGSTLIPTGAVTLGAGTVAGGVIVAHGADQMGAGFARIVNDQPEETITYEGVKALTGSSKFARTVDVGIPLMGGVTSFANGLRAAEDSVIAFSSYRAVTAVDREALDSGRGLTAKAPQGSWSAEEHVRNFSPTTKGGAIANDPWIGTSRDFSVSEGYLFNAEGELTGRGIVAINLKKVPVESQVEVHMGLPRTNMYLESLPYHRSVWAQEVAVYQHIPADAIYTPFSPWSQVSWYKSSQPGIGTMGSAFTNINDYERNQKSK